MIRHTLSFFAVIALCTACGTAVDAPTQTTNADALGGQTMCGGIAGLTCPDGQKCLIKDSYPDAAGVCVGPSEHQAWQDFCAATLCFAVECPTGYDRVYRGVQDCCGTCMPTPGSQGQGNSTPEGYCEAPSDCDGLVHIMCVGSWSCERNSCTYSCDTTTLETL